MRKTRCRVQAAEKLNVFEGYGFRDCVRTQPASLKDAAKSFSFHERKGTASAVP
jgi:hypothetical protein